MKATFLIRRHLEARRRQRQAEEDARFWGDMLIGAYVVMGLFALSAFVVELVVCLAQ